MTSVEVLDATEYRYAIEHPRAAFLDDELRGLRVRKGPMGLPKVCVGGFAMVFELYGRDEAGTNEIRKAVRCFKRLPTDLARRYQAISQTLARISQESEFFLGTRYVEQGILVTDGWRPITTLPWVDGVPLDMYFDDVHQDRGRMDRLLAQVRKLSLDFERWGIAHGDLQHGNILVTSEGRIKLIDYDGMFVPALRGQHSNEAGHADYRHPERSPERAASLYFPGLDRFALITIYLQTAAVAAHPELWSAKTCTDGLLLREADYRDPDGSETLRQFRTFQDLRRATDWFGRICQDSIEAVPKLSAFISEAGVYVPKGADIPAVPPQPRVLETPKPEVVVSTPPQPPKTPKPEVAVGTPPQPRKAGSDDVQLPLAQVRVVEASPAELGRYLGKELVVVARLVEARLVSFLGGSQTVTLELQSKGTEPVRVVVDKQLGRAYGEHGDLLKLRPGTWLAVRGTVTHRLAYVFWIGPRAIEVIDEAEAQRRVDRWHRKVVTHEGSQALSPRGPSPRGARARPAPPQPGPPPVPVTPKADSTAVERMDELAKLLKIN